MANPSASDSLLINGALQMYLFYLLTYLITYLTKIACLSVVFYSISPRDTSCLSTVYATAILSVCPSLPCLSVCLSVCHTL